MNELIELADKYAEAKDTYASTDSRLTAARNFLVEGIEKLQAENAALSLQYATNLRDAERYRWLRDNAHNVSFAHRINAYTTATTMGLHCGSLSDTIDSALRLLKDTSK